MHFERLLKYGVVLLLLLKIGEREVSASVHASPRAVVDAVFSEENRTISGTVALTVTNDTDEVLDAIPLALYPNHLKSMSGKLDGGQVRWIYPKGCSAGSMTLTRLSWNRTPIDTAAVSYPLPAPYAARKPDTVALIPLPAALKPGERGVLDVGFTVKIPIRRGRFGTYRSVTVLGGGWFPRPLTDLSGVDDSLPPDRMHLDVTLQIPAARGAVVHDRIFPLEKAPQRLVVKNIETESLVVVVMDRLEVTERKTAAGTAVHVHQTLPYHATTWKETTEDHNGLPNGLPDIGRIDYSGRILDVVENTARLLSESAPDCPLADRIVLVDIPAWDRMVQFGPGPVLLSDRLYQLLPVDDGLFFHDLALVRVVAPTLFKKALRDELPEYRFVAEDAIGVLFSERYSREIHNKRRTVKEILGFASMIPSVDELLYAPQIPFKEVYFKPIEEPDPLRDEPWYYNNHLPRGKRIAGKLVDLIGREAAFAAMVDVLEGRADFRTAVISAIPGNADFFFKQWYGTYPKVNYRVENVVDKRLGDGRIEHRFDVVREGAVLREPVTILITDHGGGRHEMVWDSDARKATLSWTSNAPVDDVIIDPKGRLVESGALTADHPLSDNRNKLPLRPPMFTRLLVWADATSGEPYVQLGFWLRRLYDTTNVISLDLDYNRSAYGALLGYYRFFGKKQTLNARTWRFGPSVSVVHYNKIDDPQFTKSEREAATMGAVGISLGRNSIQYGWDPLKGSDFFLRVSYATGRASDDSIRHVVRLSASGGRIFAPGIHHTLALYGGASAVFGEPVAGHLTSLSSREMLRGFDSDETFGRLKIFGVLEYRHTLIDASSVRAPLFTWFDRFQGALFVGGGTVSRPSGGLTDGLFSTERLYTEVGYGIRTHLLLFGVQQYLIAVDLAVPLTPRERWVRDERSDGTVREVRRKPYKVIIGIVQTF